MNRRESLSLQPNSAEQLEQQLIEEFERTLCDVHLKIRQLAHKLIAAGLALKNPFTASVVRPRVGAEGTKLVFFEASVLPEPQRVPTIFIPHAPSDWKKYPSQTPKFQDYSLYQYNLIAQLTPSKTSIHRALLAPTSDATELFMPRLNPDVTQDKLHAARELLHVLENLEVEGTRITVSDTKKFIFKDGKWLYEQPIRQLTVDNNDTSSPTWLAGEE